METEKKNSSRLHYDEIVLPTEIVMNMNITKEIVLPTEMVISDYILETNHKRPILDPLLYALINNYYSKAKNYVNFELTEKGKSLIKKNLFGKNVVENKLFDPRHIPIEFEIWRTESSKGDENHFLPIVKKIRLAVGTPKKFPKDYNNFRKSIERRDRNGGTIGYLDKNILTLDPNVYQNIMIHLIMRDEKITSTKENSKFFGRKS